MFKITLYSERCQFFWTKHARKYWSSKWKVSLAFLEKQDFTKHSLKVGKLADSLIVTGWLSAFGIDSLKIVIVKHIRLII
jgi:hypothetical protein